MAKLTGPLFSLDARGKLGGALVASSWKGINYMRRLVIPQNPKSTYQVTIRKVMNHGSKGWKDAVTGIDATQQALWNTAAAGTAESGFNRFMRQFVLANYNKTTHTMVTPNTFPTPS